MTTEFTKIAIKALSQMDRARKQQIQQAVQGLKEIPPKGDIKTLHGFVDGRKRLRVGKYRVVYRYKDNGETLCIMDIDTRGDIYK